MRGNVVQVEPIPAYSAPTIIALSNLQKTLISKELKENCKDVSQENHPDLLALKAQQIISRNFEKKQRDALRRFARYGDSPYLLMKNLISVSDIPPTPTDDQSPDESGWREQAAALLGLLGACGTVAASFEDEMGGRLCHMVMPAKNSDKSYSRSTKSLNFHTEVVNGYFLEEVSPPGKPLSPDIFVLGCLRNPDGVATTLLPIASILDSLSYAEVDDLSRPEFSASSQSSFDRNIVIEPVPVLSQLDNGLWAMRFSNSKLRGLTDRAELALAQLKARIATSCFESVSLEPGDALILNNRICLHGRSALKGTARFDGSDRWLVRIYGFHPIAKARMRGSSGRPHVMLLDE